MRRIEVLPGQKFGRWTVVKEISPRQNHRMFECQCECGTIQKVGRQPLSRGGSKSCGCLRKELSTHHGLWKSPEYHAWASMKDRCINPKSGSWKNYGGRGIVVCPQWRESFESFIQDVGRRPSDLHSLDRFPNNNGNYEPGNVRWATRKQQRVNKREIIWHRIVLRLVEMTGISPTVVQDMVALGASDVEVARWIGQCYLPEALRHG